MAALGLSDKICIFYTNVDLSFTVFITVHEYIKS